MTILDSIAASLGYSRPQKAEIGPGVLPMMYDFKMGDLFGKSDHARLMAAQLLYHTNPWVNAAERAVTSKFANVEWHLEDENDEDIGDDAKPEQKRARDLIEKPQANLPRNGSQGLTRRALWSITSRHMGLCGTTFWFGDSPDLYGIPSAYLYINPCRMTPVSNPSGYLMGYRLDAKPYDPDSGYPLTLDEVLTFHLDPGDMGHWGIGLAEASGVLAELWMLAAKHSGGVLSSGGRIAGITMPKVGVEMNDDAWLSLVRDMRTIAEDPNAAKRNLIIKKPMDFLPTAVSPKDLDLMRSLELSRDDILGYWGVPKSQIGLDVPTGLNSGGTKDRDLQVLWQGAVHSRLVPFTEVIQYQLLDRWKALGVTLELEIEEPDFTEDRPRYENAQLALSQPLRNRERREVLGLEPFGDPALDEAVWLPLTMTLGYTAPDAQGIIPVQEEDQPNEIEAKATIGKRPLIGLRRQIDAKWVPQLKVSVADVLRTQRAEVTAKVKRNAAHLMRKPTDHATWWDAGKWDKVLGKALERHAAGIASQVTSHVDAILSPKLGKASPVWAEPVTARVLRKVGQRVTGINETTRDSVVRTIQTTVERGINEGLGAAELGDALETALDDAATFDEYRAELIARTETMGAYNSAALDSYGEFGVDMVEPLDGDDDPECAARMARGPVTLAEAEADEDHPNGTLDWVPYFPEETQKATVVRDEEAISGLKAAIRSLAEPPMVHVAAPIVNIEAPPAPPPAVVNVETASFTAALHEIKAMLSAPVIREVERDTNGRPIRVTERRA